MFVGSEYDAIHSKTSVHSGALTHLGAPSSAPSLPPRTPPEPFVAQEHVRVAITQEELAILDRLTITDSGVEEVQVAEGREVPLAVERKKQTQGRHVRRDTALDPLLLAITAASGPHMTRHHYQHNFNPATEDELPFWDWTKWGSDGDVDSDSDKDKDGNSEEDGQLRPRYLSRQAPRSERLRLLRKLSADRDAVPTPGLSPDLSATQSDSEDEKASIPSLTLSAPSTYSPFETPSLSPTSTASLGLFSDDAVAVDGKPQATAEVQVKCMVRTRVPTPHGPVFLHLYHNDRDDKEHLAIVVDPAQLEEDAENKPYAPFIRSKSLDAVWHDSETPMERITRGAYAGRLSETSCVPSAPPSLYDDDDDDDDDAKTPIVATNNNITSKTFLDAPPPLVRIHSECFTGETIGSMRCDCGEQLDEAIRRISAPVRLPSGLTLPGRGAVVYMRQEGRGIGLLSKLRAYNLQDLGHDTVSANLMLGHRADERGYEVAAAILRDLDLAGDGRARWDGEGIRLLTNNPDKVAALAHAGVRVGSRESMVPRSWRCQAEGLSPASGAAHAHGDRHANASTTSTTELDEVEDAEARAARLRAAGATLIGAGATHGVELERYLRTKVLRMGHLLSLPGSEALEVRM